MKSIAAKHGDVSSLVEETRTMLLVGYGVWLEILRRKEFYVLLIFMSIYCIGVGITSIVGIENPATATFLLNFGMTFAYLSAHLLVVITGVRQIPTEIENRTLYPMLARPLRRGILILGKWFATWTSGLVVIWVLMTMAWLAAPKMQTFSGALLIQTALLHTVSLAVIAALALGLSLYMPAILAFITIALIFGFGDKASVFLRARFAHDQGERFVTWLSGYIPDFSHFNLTTRYTDGIGPIAVPQFGGLLLYGVLLIALFLFVAVQSFERRPL